MGLNGNNVAVLKLSESVLKHHLDSYPPHYRNAVREAGNDVRVAWIINPWLTKVSMKKLLKLNEKRLKQMKKN